MRFRSAIYLPLCNSLHRIRFPGVTQIVPARRARVAVPGHHQGGCIAVGVRNVALLSACTPAGSSGCSSANDKTCRYIGRCPDFRRLSFPSRREKRPAHREPHRGSAAIWRAARHPSNDDMKSGSGLAAALVLALVACVLSGCDRLSRSDQQFVEATLPAAFDSFRMYSPGGASAGRQACTAGIRTAFGDVEETAVLERGSGITFDVSATRDGLTWDISSDGVAPTDADSPLFRFLLVDCASTLQDKYRAEPAGADKRTSPLHH